METNEYRNYLIGLSVLYDGDAKKIIETINSKQGPSIRELEEIAKSVKANAITILDEEYPNNLKRIYQAPLVLYYYGDISLLNKFDVSLGVIGSRRHSKYGAYMTRTLVKGVSDKLVIVSGLAAGIDAIAADECLKNGGKTIAVLGSGIDNCYPSENKELYETIKKKGLLISEYPNEVSPDAYHFPIRNRIIAGLSNNLLITEAKKHSGTSITVHYKQDEGTILCVPTKATEDSLCNLLIQCGAKLIITPQDILEEYHIRSDEPEFEN